MATPTIAIGLGKAGCRMVDTLESMAEETGTLNDFAFLAIDTNEADVYDETPDRKFEPLALDRPVSDEEFWREDRQNFKYLSGDYSLQSGQGVTRQRAVSRYHFDGNFDDVQRFLEKGISEFVGQKVDTVEEDVSQVNIWIINSLGGGTGSGSFPLVATIVDNIVNRQDQQQAEFFVAGIGSLPRLEDLETPSPEPQVNLEYYVNAHAALTELRSLINYENETDHYPIRIEIENEPDAFDSSYLELNESPFDRYWLLGFDEEEGNTTARYRERMNQIAAYTVLTASMLDENFPDIDDLRDTKLASVTGFTVGAPIDRIREYVNIRDNVDELSDELEELKREYERRNEDIKYLDRVLSISLGTEETPTETRPVDSELVRICQDRALAFEPVELLEDNFDLDKELDGLQNKVAEHLPDDTLFGTSEIVTWFYCSALQDQIATKLAENDFENSVEEIWDKFEPDLQDTEYERFAEQSPRRKWTNALKEYLKQRAGKLRDKAESTIIPWKKRKLKKQSKQVVDIITTLENEWEVYQKLDDLEEVTVSKRNSARNRIKTRRDELETSRESKENKIGRKKTDIRRLNNKRDSLGDSLLEFKSIEKGTELPLTETEALQPSLLETTTSIASLIGDELIDERVVGQALSNYLDDTSYVTNPVEDVPNVKQTKTSTQSLAVALSSSENFDAGLLQIELSADRDVDAQFDQEFDHGLYNKIEVNDPFNIWVLSFFFDMELRNTSEFQTMHKLFTDDDSNVGDELGDYTDDDVASRFAYPELVDIDEVESYFG